MATDNSTLTQTYLKEVLRYNPYEGTFIWLINRANRAAGSIAGGIRPNGYLGITVCGRPTYAHRLAWLYMYGEYDQEMEIDHKDGDPLNNRIDNLRLVTHQENQHNRRHVNKNNSSGLPGAYLRKSGRWNAKIWVNSKGISLGHFDTKEEAHLAYLDGKKKFHPSAIIAEPA